jgi:mono/diheme cytochrome c family protein
MNRMNLRGSARRAGTIALVLTVMLGALVAWLNVRGEASLEVGGPTAPASSAVIERGAYLARAGNCMGCHTTIGGAEFAGGRGVDTPFGVVVAPNITPDVTTGIGTWSASEFWRSMHHGRAKDGRLLYPAFPYPSFTRVSREDSDALYAFLRSVPAVEKANAPHALRFPYNTQAALAVWRALYFRPGGFEHEAGQSSDWNRGKYLTQGLGHCAGCHSGRNFLGGISLNAEFAGGLMADGAWYAPSLASPHEAGVQGWSREQVVRLLKDGVSAHASVSGPMADVVFTSTRYLTDQDLDAMARYLASIPVREEPPAETRRADAQRMVAGGKVYDQHCADCHGDRGQGVSGMYPALAGNRAVTLASHNNLVQGIRHGGFMPTTAGNRQPFGMPPYGQVLSNEETAAVATFIRQSWGNSAAPVSTLNVLHVN